MQGQADGKKPLLYQGSCQCRRRKEARLVWESRLAFSGSLGPHSRCRDLWEYQSSHRAHSVGQVHVCPALTVPGDPLITELWKSRALTPKQASWLPLSKGLPWNPASGGAIEPSVDFSEKHRVDGTLLGRGPAYPSSCHQLVTKVVCGCLFPDANCKAFLPLPSHCLWSAWIRDRLPGALNWTLPSSSRY